MGVGTFQRFSLRSFKSEDFYGPSAPDLEVYDYELIYKPGKKNVVADSLSGTQLGTNVNSMTATVHSDKTSDEDLISCVECPINCFKNQLLIVEEEDDYKFDIPFPSYHLHTIKKPKFSEEDLIKVFKKYLDPNLVNGLCTKESIMGQIQIFYPKHLPTYKIRYTHTVVEDIKSEIHQEEAILKEHQRAHRGIKDNRLQLLRSVFCPKMDTKIKQILRQCLICKINSTPIPQYPGHIAHIDIYIAEK